MDPIREKMMELEARANGIDLSGYSTSGITSRDQIIDPYSIVDIRDYSNSATGQARYNADLQRLMRIAEQQEASYLEWYNSPEQQRIRDVAAGLNPDIVGLSGSEGVDTSPAQQSPLAGIPTKEALEAQKYSSISSLVTSLAGVANLAGSFLGLRPTIEGQKLSNITALQSLMSKDISGLLSTALDADGSLDLDAWFADDANFSSLVDVYGSYDGFAPALAMARRSMLAHRKQAVEIQRDVASAQMDYGMIAGSPLYSDDQKILLAQILPFMTAVQAEKEARIARDKAVADWQKRYHDSLDVDKAVDVANSQAEYDAAYIQARDAELDGINDSYMKKVQAAQAKLHNEIDENLMMAFRSDPSSLSGAAAAFLVGDHAGMKWSEFYASYILVHPGVLVPDDPSNPNATIADFVDDYLAGSLEAATYPGRAR